MAGIEILIGAAAFLLVVAIVAVCLSCFFCCFCPHLLCAVGTFSLFAGSQMSMVERRKRQAAMYQSISNASEDSGYYGAPQSSSAPPLTEAEAEAFYVAPLAAARIVEGNEYEYKGEEYKVNYSSSNGESRVQESDGTVKPLPDQYKDKWAAILFLANVLVVCFFAIYYSFDYSRSGKAPSAYQGHQGLVGMLLAVAIIGICCVAVGLLWMTALTKFPRGIIVFVLRANVAIFLIAAVLCFFFTYDLVGTVILAVIAFINFWYLRSVADRIPFASAMLYVTTTVVQANYTGIMLTALCMMLLQFGWLYIWSLTSYGAHLALAEDTRNDDDNDYEDGVTPVQGLAIAGLLLSLYWGVQTISTVNQATVAGTVGCWWFQPLREQAVQGSLFRAATTSFGTVCFGSLLIAIVSTVRRIVDSLRDTSRRNQRRNQLTEFMIVCTDCTMRWLESAMKYFNKYAICYTAAYGDDLIAAGSKVFNLFSNKGWTAIINDNLVHNALLLGCVVIAACGVLIGYTVSLLAGSWLTQAGAEKPYLLLMVLGGVMGAAVGVTISNSIDAGVAMVFVCLAENPAVLMKHHPIEYDVLAQAWDVMYPYAGGHGGYEGGANGGGDGPRNPFATPQSLPGGGIGAGMAGMAGGGAGGNGLGKPSVYHHVVATPVTAPTAPQFDSYQHPYQQQEPSHSSLHLPPRGDLPPGYQKPY